MRAKYITADRRMNLMRSARCWLLLPLLLASACSPEHTPKATGPNDPVQEAWYGTAVAELEASNRKAEALYRAGDADAASKLVEHGEMIASRLVAVPRPTLAAAEAADAVDDLYGRMLLSNRHFGWARLQFQKNAARWKRWQPQTANTQQRLRKALSAIDECDRQMTKP